MKDNIEIELEEYIKNSNESFYVVQIGANDGKMADPIYNKAIRFGWSGVLVEPVKYLYNRLVNNYKNTNTNLQFENSVITTHTGTIDFYQFPMELESNEEFPFWANGMGSILKPFSSLGHNTLKDKNFEMIKQKTPCLTFEDLIKKYNVKNIDLLQTDIEGYDGTLLTSIDFSLIKPKFIRYEDKHIDTALRDGLTEVSSQQVVEYLKTSGYDVGGRSNGFDRVCKLKNI